MRAPLLNFVVARLAASAKASARLIPQARRSLLTRRSPPSDEGGWRRRDRAIQYAEASRFRFAFSGILDRPPEPVIRPAEGRTGWRTMTAGGWRACAPNTPPHSRGANAPELLSEPPSKNKRAQGRPGASSHPRPVCIGRKHTVVATGGAGSSGLPCAMVLTAYCVLSPGTGLSCPRHFRRYCLPRKLSASVGAPGPHDFAVRAQRRSSSDTAASTASHPAFVTTRTPLLPRRDDAENTQFLIFRK
jgi:hypothetical protein